MKKMMILLLTLFVLSAASMNAQVSIGSGNPPTPGTVLDLSQSGALGLRLPIVSLSGDNTLQLTGGDIDSVGIVVYNDGKGGLPAGLYVWGGDKWSVVTSTGGANNGNYETQLIGDYWWTTENISYGTSETDYYATRFNNGKDTVISIGFIKPDSVIYKKGLREYYNNGYYYKKAQAIAACASLGSGWYLPGKEEWDALKSAYANMNDKDVMKWSAAPWALAGCYDGGTLNGGEWRMFDRVSYWWSTEMKWSPDGCVRLIAPYTIIEDFTAPNVISEDYGASVRCVKDNRVRP